MLPHHEHSTLYFVSSLPASLSIVLPLDKQSLRSIEKGEFGGKLTLLFPPCSSCVALPFPAHQCDAYFNEKVRCSLNLFNILLTRWGEEFFSGHDKRLPDLLPFLS
jgi:hypothetical protein